MYLKRKYQVGGIAYTPFLPAQAGSPQESTSNSGSSSTSSPEKISGTMTKEIVELLKSNGIPSDVSTFLNVANQFLTRSKALSTSSLFGGTDDYDISDLIKIQQLVNDVKYNNALKDEAVKQVTKEAAGSEVAITDTGYIYAYNNKGNIIKLTPKEFKENYDKYQPLTNNELLYAREHEQGLAFQTGILNDLQNTIGMATITKQLRDTIKAFGSDKVGGYTTKDKAVNEGMLALMQAGPDGFYQFENEEQLRNVNRALHYLYNSMSENAKNLLRAKTAVDGGDPNDPNDISNLLLQALYEHTSRTTTVKFDKTATKYDPKQTGAKGGSEQLTTDTYPEALVSGSGLNPARYINIMPSNTNVSLKAYAQNAGPVLKDKENRMNVSNLQLVLTNGYGIGAVSNAQSITFGDQLLNPTQYKNMMVDTYTDMERVYLPITYSEDGRITPDFKAQQKLDQLQQYIAQQNGNVADIWISNWVEENIPHAKWNSETKQVVFDQTYSRPFLVLHGIAAKNRVSFDTNSPYLHHLSSDEGNRWDDEYERVVTEESILGKIEHNKAKGSTRWKYYSGNIYIPISGPTTGSLIYNHQFYPKSTYTDITQKATANQTRQQLKTTW